MGMPSFHKFCSMFDDHSAQSGKIAWPETLRSSQYHGVEPIFCGPIVTFDMDMWRLAIFMTVKEKTGMIQGVKPLASLTRI
jgi:hypothetical protein